MGRPSPECRSRLTFDRSPVRESRTPGSARGAGGNSCSYRDQRSGMHPYDALIDVLAAAKQAKDPSKNNLNTLSGFLTFRV